MQGIAFKLYHVLTYIDIGLFLFLTIFLIYSFKKLSSMLKVFTCVGTVVFCIAAISLVMGKLSIDNTMLFHAFLFVQLFWMVAYYFMLFKHKRLKVVVAALASVFLAYSVRQYIAYWDILKTEMGGEIYVISNLLFIGFSVLFYINAITGKDVPKHPLINAGVLIYFSGSSMVFLFGNYLKETELSYQMILWIFNVALHIVFLVLISIDVWKTLYHKRVVL